MGRCRRVPIEMMHLTVGNATQVRHVDTQGTDTNLAYANTKCDVRVYKHVM